MTNQEFFTRVISGSHTGIDTCSWLIDQEERQEAFFHNLEEAQRATGATVWVIEETIKEIRSKLNAPDLRLCAAAKRALEYLYKMQNEGRLVVYQSARGDSRRPFADPSFLSALIANRDSCVALITQDRGLACDCLNLNDLESVKGGKELRVYRVNGGGMLNRFQMPKVNGKHVDPRNNDLYTPGGTVPVTSVDNTLVSRPAMHPGDQL